MAKEFMYKGKTLDQLKAMDVREFAKIVPSRRRRKMLRQYDKLEKFANKCQEKAARGKKIKTHSRSMIVVPKMVGLTIHIHNGKEFLPVLILPEMLCHYLGEFSLTRKKVAHSAPGIGATRSSASLSVK